jgi:hypothetical protein
MVDRGVEEGGALLVGGTGPAIGAELGGYRLEALVGRGGMSAVYRADDLRLGRRVAVKVLAPELAQDARFRERFLVESRLAASIDHAAIVPIFEAGEAGSQLYIAMRYVESGDLRDLLRREGPLAPDRAIALVDQVAGALDAARHGRRRSHTACLPRRRGLGEQRVVGHRDRGPWGRSRPQDRRRRRSERHCVRRRRRLGRQHARRDRLADRSGARRRRAHRSARRRGRSNGDQRDGGGVWVANEFAGTVVRLDARSGASATTSTTHSGGC